MLLTCSSCVTDSCDFIICCTYSSYQPLTCAPMTGYSDRLIQHHHSKWLNPCRGANHKSRVMFPHWWRKREKVCSELCQSINVCVKHACYSFKYEHWETGRQSDRQAAGQWILTNPVQFHRGWRCVRVCVFQLNLASVQKSNVSVAGLRLAASKAPTTCQSLRGRRSLQGKPGETRRVGGADSH